MNYQSASTAILETCESRIQSLGGLAISGVRAWISAHDRPRALRNARAASNHKVFGLILVAKHFGFRSLSQTEPSLLDEILSNIRATPEPMQRDRYYSPLFAALRRCGQVDSALDVLRMIQSPVLRCDAVVNPEQYVEPHPIFVQESFLALKQIEDPDDRIGMEDDITRPLATVGRMDDALRLVADADDVVGGDAEYHRVRRQLGVAEGLMDRKAFSAAFEYACKAVEVLRGGLEGGFANGLYADAAVLFARLGEFTNAIDTIELSDKRGDYVVFKMKEVCRLLIAKGLEQPALDLALTIPHLYQAAALLTDVAESQARAGKMEQAITLLGDTAGELIKVSGEAAADRRNAHSREPYVSSTSSAEHQSASALNQIAGAYLRMGQIESAIRTMVRPIPEGADRNQFPLQARDSRQLALTAAQLGHTDPARILLDYALSCAKPSSPDMAYDDAESLSGLVAPNLLLGRPGEAKEIWTTLEKSPCHNTTLLSACFRIGSDCLALKSDMPDDLVAGICGAIRRI